MNDLTLGKVLIPTVDIKLIEGNPMKHKLTNKERLTVIKGAGWRRCVSVCGPKTHFHYRRFKDVHQWVCWDRIGNSWVFETE